MNGNAGRTLVKTLALAICLAMPLQAMAQAVVVRSTGPSAVNYPKGKRLPAAAQVTLQAGDIVTVLDKAGTRVLRGAGTFSLTVTINRDRGGAALLARSLSNPASVRAGAVRGAGDEMGGTVMPVSIWLADTEQGGTVCVPRGSDLYLWRTDSERRSFSWLTEALFNSLTRQLEPFEPIHPGEARVYSCGPTVYNYPHIGNMRAYVFADTLGRTLSGRATSSPTSSTSPMSAT
jgi:hypothetical protein